MIMRHIPGRGWRLLLVVAVVVLATGGAVAYATIPDDGVVHACYGNNGSLRAFDPSAGEECRNSAVDLLTPAGKAASAAHADTADSASNAANADNLDGVDSSGFMPASSIYAVTPARAIGPLPVSWSIETHGNPIVVQFSGTGFATSTGLKFLQLSVDGNPLMLDGFHFSETGSHRTFPTASATARPLAAGTHTVSIEASGVSSDFNDRYYITVLELPLG